MRGSRNFRRTGGGGVGEGVQVHLRYKIEKKALTTFFSPQLILQKSNGYFQRKLSFSKVPEGVQHFPGVFQLFPGGGGGRSICLFPIETHITCDFSRRIQTPYPLSASDPVL